MNQDAAVWALFVGSALALYGAHLGVQARRRTIQQRAATRAAERCRRAAALAHRTRRHPVRRQVPAGADRDAGGGDLLTTLAVIAAGALVVLLAAVALGWTATGGIR